MLAYARTSREAGYHPSCSVPRGREWSTRGTVHPGGLRLASEIWCSRPGHHKVYHRSYMIDHV